MIEDEREASDTVRGLIKFVVAGILVAGACNQLDLQLQELLQICCNFAS